MNAKSILVIDPDPASLAFLARALTARQFNVLQAGSGREGLISAWRDRPDLILIDPQLPDLPGEILIEKLRADARTAVTPIVALSSDPSPARQKVCLQAGCNEFMAKTGQAMAALFELLPGLLFGQPVPRKQPAAVKQGAQIVFLSAKGGTGTSSLTANIANCLLRKQPEASVVVADLVLPLGSIARIVGQTSPVNLVSIAEMDPAKLGPEDFRAHLTQPNLWDFYLLAGAPDPDSANLLKIGHIPEILAGLRATFDYVVIDLGRSLSKISLPIIEQADVIVPVISTDLSCVELTRVVWDYLRQSISPQSVFAILNRPVGLEGLTKADVERLSGLEMRITLPYMGGALTLANNQHQPVAHKFPNDSSTMVLQQAAEGIAALARHRAEK